MRLELYYVTIKRPACLHGLSKVRFGVSSYSYEGSEGIWYDENGDKLKEEGTLSMEMAKPGGLI